jgi:hypothetical protein
MKRLLRPLILLSFCFVVFHSNVYCIVLSNEHGTSLDCRDHNCGNFFMYSNRGKICYNDEAVPIGGTHMSERQGGDLIELNPYFTDFDYPSRNFSLISPQHSSNAFSIYEEEEACFKIKYNDISDNPPSLRVSLLIINFS